MGLDLPALPRTSPRVSTHEFGGSPLVGCAVVVRMRWHAPTIAYVTRRTTEGLSKKEIICCLIGRVWRSRRLAKMPSLSVNAGR